MNRACVIFLIDEAPSMRMRIAEGTHTKMDSIATAVNSAIRQMEGRPPVDVAVIGYHRNLDGLPEVGSRFGGAFSGRIWVSSDELTAAPVRVEERTRQVVNPVTRAVTPMTVNFPVWYESKVGPGKMEYLPVFEFTANVLQEWTQNSQPAAPPLIFSFLSDLQPGVSIANAVVPLGKVSTPQGPPFVLQFHAGTYANVPAIKYPAAPNFLPYGPVQELFFGCSILTDPMLDSLRQNQEFPPPGGKGLVYNGRMIDMVRMLGILGVYQNSIPAADQSPAPETVSSTISDLPVPENVPVSQPIPPIPLAASSGVPVPPPIPEEVSRHVSPPENEVEKTHAERFPMPALFSHSAEENFIFREFDKAEDEDGSLADIPPVDQLPEVKSEAVPDGFEFRCRALSTNKVPEGSSDLSPRLTLMILLVDRSVTDLTYRPAVEMWTRRLEKTRFMLGELSRRGRGRYDAALIFYGKEADGSMSVESGTLGRSFLPDNLLAEAAGKVESMTIQIPNGIGGLISLPRKKLSFTDCSPTYPASPIPGFQRAVEIVREWDSAREEKLLAPILLHITAGKFLMDEFDAAIECLSAPDLPPIQLQHWVFTERPHSGVCCPSSLDFTQDETLQAIWERTAPLPGREFLAGVRPGIHEESSGMMVNMDFDVLFEVLDTLAAKNRRPSDL
ncbi:MAG: hypothetical protein IJD43_13780 [Thermoguttaceae bacterium]|nr:hypothetical protein [Thermoguttaceae bacterium]